MAKTIVVVGGVAGGASFAARARRLDESANIVMLERGEHISFANCGLPYFISGEGICSGRCYDDSIIVATGTTSISEYS